MIARSIFRRIWHSVTSNGFVVRKATSFDDLKCLSELFAKKDGLWVKMNCDVPSAVIPRDFL